MHSKIPLQILLTIFLFLKNNAAIKDGFNNFFKKVRGSKSKNPDNKIQWEFGRNAPSLKAPNGGPRASAVVPTAAHSLGGVVSQKSAVESTTPTATTVVEKGRTSRSLDAVLDGINWLVDEICTSIMGEDEEEKDGMASHSDREKIISDTDNSGSVSFENKKGASTKRTEKGDKVKSVQNEGATEKMKRSNPSRSQALPSPSASPISKSLEKFEKKKNEKTVEKHKIISNQQNGSHIFNNSNRRPSDLLYEFNPPSAERQKNNINILLRGKATDHKLENIFERNEEFKVFDPEKTVPNPEKIKENEGNGDCLFRSIAYALLGTEQLHREVRQHIANFYANYIGRENDLPGKERWIREMLLIDRSDDYQSFESIGEYVKYLKSPGINQWGGLVDIVAAAKAFNVNMMLFYKNDWICYSPDTVDQTKFKAFSTVFRHGIRKREGQHSSYNLSKIITSTPFWVWHKNGQMEKCKGNQMKVKRN